MKNCRDSKKVIISLKQFEKPNLPLFFPPLTPTTFEVKRYPSGFPNIDKS